MWDMFWAVVVFGPLAVLVVHGMARELRFAVWMRCHDRVVVRRPALVATPVRQLRPAVPVRGWAGSVVDGELVEPQGR